MCSIESNGVLEPIEITDSEPDETQEIKTRNQSCFQSCVGNYEFSTFVG